LAEQRGFKLTLEEDYNEGCGIGFDTSQYHFYCTKKALMAKELQQLLDVIAALDEDMG
jgi:hypothetical protein